MLFTVKDSGRPIMVAYSGGTAFNFPFTGSANFETYIKSQDNGHRSSAANATILMSNHTEFDSAIPKIKFLALRKPGAARRPRPAGRAAHSQ